MSAYKQTIHFMLEYQDCNVWSIYEGGYTSLTKAKQAMVRANKYQKEKLKLRVVKVFSQYYEVCHNEY